jgi:hypothetical protein
MQARAGYRPGMTTPPAATPATRILLVTAVPLEQDQIDRVLADDDLRAASVRVLAPSLNDSALAFWVSDADEAIAEARDAAAATGRAVDAASSDDTTVSAAVGESDPLLAIGDALRVFPADRIVTVRRDGPAASHLEEQLEPEALEGEFGVPVRAHVIVG